MYNSNTPNNADLPSTGKLIRSTILAAIGAGIILVTVVMPSEYGIDPTGIGGALGLTNMGEIKTALAEEAAADAIAHSPEPVQAEAEIEVSPSLDEEVVIEETIELEEPAPSGHGHGHHHGDGNFHQH